MDATRFDSLTRLLAGSAPRRRAIAALALVAFGVAQGADDSLAGPGCENVGKECKRDNQCCSGVCKGGKNKRCKAHDTGGCGKNNGGCNGRDCTTSAGQQGECFTTTGNAGYCADTGECVPCKKDKDCRPFCGAKAACVRCSECDDDGGTACVGPGACVFQ